MRIGLLNIAPAGEVAKYVLQRIPIKKVCNGYYLRWYYNGWHYWFFLPGTLTVVTEGEKYRTIGTRKIAMGSGQITRGQALGIRTIMYTREVSLLTIAGWMNIRIEPGTLTIYDNQLAGAEIEFIAVIGSKDISYGDGYTPVNIIPVISYPYTTCEVIIGTQIWACKNFDSNYPGSKVYNDDETNRATYGGLYTYLQVMSSGFVPAGWHVPTVAEWQTLIYFVGDDTDAGGHLKEAGLDHWNTPNDLNADNSSFFTALGAGFFYSVYTYQKVMTLFWTADEYSTSNAYRFKLDYDSAGILQGDTPKDFYLSVRLIKDTPHVPLTFNDWFLPSRDGVNAMYTNLHLEGVGGFENLMYWSSSEKNATTAWGVIFSNGTVIEDGKSVEQNVRACRSFADIVGAYSLRDTGPSGGLIFYIDGAGTTYYEAAPSDQAGAGIQKWSSVWFTLIGTTGTAIGTGQANTTAIIAQHGPGGNSAAKLCDDLIIYH